jgi:anti-sigma-K factor RskA
MAEPYEHIDAEFQEQCLDYLLSNPQGEDAERFEQRLKSADADERQFYAEIKELIAELSATVSPEIPPERIKERVLSYIQADIQRRSGLSGSTRRKPTKEDPKTDTKIYGMGGEDDRTTNFRTWAIAASFLLITGFGGWAYYQYQQSEVTLQEQQQTIVRLQEQLDRKDELLAVLESRTIQVVMMNGQEVNPNGYGKIIWDQDQQQALLQVANLPPVPTDKDYQLWMIKDGKPISAGVFAVNRPNQDKFFKIEKLNEGAQKPAFAVTMEPKGGVPQPTGDMYLLGQ